MINHASTTINGVMEAIGTSFEAEFGTPLLTGIVRQTDADDAWYGYLDYVGGAQSGVNFGSGEVAYDLTFDITLIYILPHPSEVTPTRHIFALHDFVDRIEGWLKFQRFGLAGTEGIGVKSVQDVPNDSNARQFSWVIRFQLQILKGNPEYFNLYPDVDPVNVINARINDDDSRVIARREV